jgi:ribulose 1,5-bisphosphate carboxylase large subunit-like protein
MIPMAGAWGPCDSIDIRKAALTPMNKAVVQPALRISRNLFHGDGRPQPCGRLGFVKDDWNLTPAKFSKLHQRLTGNRHSMSKAQQLSQKFSQRTDANSCAHRPIWKGWR